MTKFCRTFPEPWMAILANIAKQRDGLNQDDWWRELLAYRFQDVGGAQQQLALAVRNGYLNAYVEGQSVLKIRFDDTVRPSRLCAQVHYKYLGGDYRVFDGMEVERTIYKCKKSLDCWIKKAQTFAKPRRGSGDFSEKQGVAAIVGRNSNVIDLEMALPGEVAPRIDMVALERSGSAINIVFYEAKLFSNPGLRARNFQPKVTEQLDGYENWLTSNDRRAEVVSAYRETCRLLITLREMQGILVDELVVQASKADSDLRVDPKPRLIIFGPQTARDTLYWTPHENALRQAGVTGSRLIIEDHPKDVRLSAGTQDGPNIDKN